MHAAKWIYTQLIVIVMSHMAWAAPTNFPMTQEDILVAQQGWGVLKINEEVVSGPLRVGTKTYATGIGTHAESRIALKLPDKASLFSGAVGVTPNNNQEGSIVAKIVGDGRDILFESAILRPGNEAVEFSLPVQNHRYLELIVSDANDGGSNDHANWVNLQVETSGRPKFGFPQNEWSLERVECETAAIRFVSQTTEFQGRVAFPKIPDDPCQEIMKSDVYVLVNGQRNDCGILKDLNPLQQEVYYADIKESSEVKAIADIQVRFFDTQLVPVVPVVPDQEITPLSSVERAVYLKDDWKREEDRVFFRSWITQHDLWRTNEESEMSFAMRVLEMMDARFQYKIPDEIPEHIALVKEDPRMGDWRYTLETYTGECLRLSGVFSEVLRANFIPVRHVSGNFAPELGHHLRSLVYFEGVGWTPMEPTNATVNAKRGFGRWGGNFISGNKNRDFRIPEIGGIGTFDRWWFSFKLPPNSPPRKQPEGMMEMKRYAFPDYEGEIISHQQGWGQLHINQTVDGSRLRIGTKTYEKGLGTHANSTIRIRLPKNVRKISGEVGVTPNKARRGSILAAVIGDGKLLGQSDVLYAGRKAMPFSFDVEGVEILELAVNDAGDGGDYDHANWVDLKLEKE